MSAPGFPMGLDLTEKTCSRCKETKPASEYTVTTQRGKYRYLNSLCKPCAIASASESYYRRRVELMDRMNKKRAELTPDEVRERREKHRAWAKQRRRKVVAYYSHGTMSCACCGENHYDFLAIDHVHGAGKRHRKDVGRQLIGWLFRQGLPEGFQILCHNCNMAKGFFGVCPHEMERKQ